MSRHSYCLHIKILLSSCELYTLLWRCLDHFTFILIGLEFKTSMKLKPTSKLRDPIVRTLHLSTLHMHSLNIHKVKISIFIIFFLKCKNTGMTQYLLILLSAVISCDQATQREPFTSCKTLLNWMQNQRKSLKWLCRVCKVENHTSPVQRIRKIYKVSVIS